VKAISPYLFDGGLLTDKHTVVAEVSRPPNQVPRVLAGSQPLDFEQLILDSGEAKEFTKNAPHLAKFLRPYFGSEEFINGGRNSIIYLRETSPNEIRPHPELLRRLEVIRERRLASKRKQTLQIANEPWQFNYAVVPTSDFLVIPKVSSESRSYVPIGYESPPAIPSDLVFVVEGGSLDFFALLTSRMHMAWLRYIGGRLKSDYRYSIGLVYNPFPWPELDDAKKEKIGKLGQVILDARANHPQSTLADLYDPLTMPADLRKAHEANDKAVDQLYRKEPFASDRERVEFLLARYEQITAPALAFAAQKPKRTKRKNEAGPLPAQG
jgi:hypothetical protein